MSRLTRSKQGYMRSLQISTYNMFVFVEGKSSDPYFYGSICDIATADTPIAYCICRASELPGGTGGKQALLELFKYMRIRGALVDEFKGKKTAMLFFVDKDIDDLMRRTLKSDHLCYTKYYNIENYIFKHGAIAQGGALATSMERRHIVSRMGDQEAWRRRVASNLADWMAMCLYAAKKNIRCECGFGKHSSINAGGHGAIDQVERSRLLSMLEVRSGQSHAQFQAEFNRVLRQVRRLCINGEHDRIFNGKWYSLLLAEEMRRIAGSLPYEEKALNAKLKSNVLSTLDFGAGWAVQLVERVKSILAKL